MEKKQLISVVKPLIAAALLFGSSGGVAWGQIYKSQRNPDKAQASADKKERAQLRAYGDLNGGWSGTSGSDAGCPAAGSSDPGWTRTIHGSFVLDNNFGPGESGTITPAGNNSGTWSPIGTGTSVTRTTFNTGDGIITVGGTTNHIGHLVTGGNESQGGAGFNNSRYHDGASVTTSVGINSDRRNPSAGGYTIGTYNGSWYVTVSHGATRYWVQRPTVPNVSESFFTATMPAAGTGPGVSIPGETKIIVDGRTASSASPWQLQIFNFLKNPWYYYKTVLGSTTCSVTSPAISYEEYTRHGSHPHYTWSWDPKTQPGSTQTYQRVTYTTTQNEGGTDINARIELLAGSHVRLTGYLNKSIGHGTLGGTNAYLNLPASYYTLMNDDNVEFGSIKYNSNGGNAVDPVLGTDAVFGINKTLDKDLKTNTAGGTILIGAITRTDATSQGKITIQAATVNAGEPLGFAASGDVVYTGTCIPKAGTANLGNYQSNSPEEITVDNSLNLPTSLGAGALQIFNTRHNLVMDKTYSPTMGTGHMLIMAYKELKTTKALNVTGSSSGNTNLVGGDVDLGADETYTGTSTGSYRVIAYGNGNHIPPAFSGFTVNWGSCTAAHNWCSIPEQTRFFNTNDPTSDASSRTSNSGSAGNTFKANYSCFNAFGGSNGDITNSATITSTVNVGTSSSTARWQAARHINVNAASTFNWTSTGSGNMWWAAQDDIYPQGTITWKKSGTSSGVAYWQAGNNIEVISPNTLTANWEIDATGVTNAMRWLAGNDIKFPSGATVTATWKTKSTIPTGNILWEAGHDIVSEATLTADWEVEANAAGSARWLAKRNIDIKLPASSSIAWKSDGGSTGDLEWIAGGYLKVDNVAASPVTFTQLGKTGNTLWQAVGNIEALGPKTFTNSSTGTGNPGTGGKTIWNARGHIITGNGTGNSAPQIVRFERTTPNAGLMAWQSGLDIRTGSKTQFENNAATNISNMEWFACNNIFTQYGATSGDTGDNHDVTFTNDGKGSMIWHANTGNIETRSKTSFNNSGDGHMTWYARKNIKTYFGTQTTSDQLNQGIIFTQTGKGRTVWFAEDDDIETSNPVHFDWSGATSDATSIMWWAGRHIEIGHNFNSNNPLISRAKFETNVNDTILLKSKNGHILTNSQVDIERTNTGKALTKLWAGCGTFNTNNNIDIENVFNYTEPSNGQAAGALVHLYAENDIRSNWVCDSDRPAPILFDISGAAAGSKTRTLWEAERNIETKGRADFNYKGATAAKSLVWLSRAGYIQTERPVTVVYESDDTVSFRAETWRHDVASNPTVLSNAIASGRQGNIHFFDSINIKRYNTGVGVTEIKAENHIWTAMVDYWENSGATANKMDIISHKGDIYLGYNNGAAVGYSHNPYIANQQTPGWKVTQKAPSFSCVNPSMSSVSYDENIFKYYVPATNTSGHLWIKAGWEEKTDRNSVPDKTSNSNIDTARASGGNIYFTHIDVKQETGSKHPTVISIPHSGLWLCGRDSLLHNRSGDAMEYYENAGIISGVRRCLFPYPDASITGARNISDRIGLIYRGAIGDLTVDAGNRGNIIFNKGAYLSFEDPSSTGDVVFRTRFGDIDMRTPFDVDTMHGSLLFLAQIENIADLEHSGFCGCAEERNNVYLQDFEFKAHGASGSVFVGADNNIKLNYGGLQNIGTRHDPFLSKDYTPCRDGGQAKIGYGYDGTTCGDNLHCDAVASENKARTFLMKFDKDANNTAITKGGFAAVASDYIDVYKKFAYYGGSGSGMGSVPGTGTLHGETVSGYGLFMKTQANKGNWNVNIFENSPTCPTPCDGTNCGHDYLHMVSRMTFHDDAYIEAHNQEVMLWSPVIETFGDMTLDSEKDKGSKTEITLKADSLIFHSDFVKKGKNIKLSTWSGLHNDLPIMKFGHMRKTPPFIEAKKDDCGAYTECVPCYRYIRFSKDPLHMLDTITIKFGDGAYMERLNTVVFDHTVLTCLTDSFDHVMGGAVQNAQIRTDTFKIRNQVDLFADEKHERDAHLELISEEQMGSKDYAGIYTKHLHMEPIGACGTPYSELWTSDDLALDVITTSIFGGFGFIHSDVHVENGGHLNAGFTSLRLKGMCYEHMCGTQRMKDLRLDVGAQLHFSVGTSKGLNGEYSDAIEVDRLTTYGSVDVNIEIRPCEKIEKRCYPIIYYKSVTPNSLNQLKLNPRKVKIDGEEYPLHLNLGTDGVVYVCVGDAQPVDINRTVTLPSVSGVKTDPGAGIWDVKSRGNFKFKATYSGSKPLAVRTNRTVNGVPEMLTGTKNANGEYEYVVPNVQQDITLSIGPDYVSNQLLAGTAVWSHGEMIYIRVDRADIASIYSVAGQLVRKVDLPEGDTSIPMSRGAYVITLKDGSVHKVIVK